jgi:hypothetical protein
MNKAFPLLIAIVAFAAGVIVAVAGISFANPELQLEYGQCRFSKAQNGTYYDQALNPRLYLTPRCAEIGIANKFGGSTWGWRIGYISSGSVESRDSRAWINDGNWSDPRPCPEATNNCQAIVGGSGRMEGVSFTLTKERKLAGKWWLRGEGGLMFFRHYFHGHAHPEGFDSTPLILDGTFKGTPDRWEGLDQSSDWKGWPVPRAGLQFGFGPIYLSARYTLAPGAGGLPGHDGSSVTNHAFLQIAVGVSIPLL